MWQQAKRRQPKMAEEIFNSSAKPTGKQEINLLLCG